MIAGTKLHVCHKSDDLFIYQKSLLPKITAVAPGQKLNSMLPTQLREEKK
jgi:hypothetical protein